MPFSQLEHILPTAARLWHRSSVEMASIRVQLLCHACGQPHEWAGDGLLRHCTCHHAIPYGHRMPKISVLPWLAFPSIAKSLYPTNVTISINSLLVIDQG